MSVRANTVRFAATIGLAMILLPVAASAAEIKLMCPAPMRTTIVELVVQFERSSPHRVEIVHAPSSFIVKRVRGGEAADVTILTAQASDELIKEGKLVRRVDIARSSIGVAVLASAPKPDVSSADALKRTLLAVKTFARNEGAESGMHMLRVFERLGGAADARALCGVRRGAAAAAGRIADDHPVFGRGGHNQQATRSSRSAVAIPEIAGRRRSAQG